MRLRNNAFTQVELLLALAVMGVAGVVGFEAVRQNLNFFRRVVDATQRGSQERIAIALLRKDVRLATLKADTFSFTGTAHHLQLVRTTESPGVFWEVEYNLKTDPESGRTQLWRRVQGRDILLEEDMEPFVLSYFDGSTWFNTWEWMGGIRGLPVAVRYESKTSEVVFPIMVSVLNTRRTL